MTVRGRRLAAILILAALPGWAPQSALAPAGDEAERIALLSWILFVGATAILLIVIAALALAIHGAEPVRRVIGSEGAIRWGGIVFPSVVLTLLLGYGLWLMREAIAAQTTPALRIAVTGEQWWWRVDYQRDGAAPVREANEIRIPVGREIGEQPVALSPGAAARGPVVNHAAVCLVDDDEVGGRPEEVVATAVSLDEVRRDDGDRVALEDRLTELEATLQPGDARPEHQLRLEPELLPQLPLPLLGECWWTQHREPSG